MDKARRLYPLAAVFGRGEQPSAAKLSAISTQAKAAIDKLEFITGDLWNAAGDLILSPTGDITKNALHIPNLARAIGKLSVLNEMVSLQPPLSTSMKYTDDVGTPYAGATEGWLTYKPAATPDSSNMILAGTFSPLIQIQFQATPANIAVTGDWTVTADGKLYTFDNIPSTLLLEYVPDIRSVVTGVDGTDEPGWNVIPDPSTWSGVYSGLKISFANNTDATNGYHIWMPPRKPLGLDRTIYNTLSGTSPNIKASPDAGNLLAYQDITSDAALTNGNHYRYNLPAEITGGAANSQLPSGFLYLWDEEFGTIIDNVVYYTPANTAHSKFKVKVVSADLANVFGDTIGAGIITDDTTQLPADYISRFKLITVGTSLAKAVASLIKFAADHTHLNTDGSKTIPHSQLDNLVTPSASSHYPSTVPTFVPSFWENDDHTQYLHRGGSTYDLGESRDQWNNYIFNHLIVWDQANVLGIDVGMSITGQASVVGLNSPLWMYPTGSGQTSDSNRVGISMGAGPIITWSATNTNVDTMSIRGGATTGVAQLVNAQFQKIYLALDTNFSRSGYFLNWDNTDKILTLSTSTTPAPVFEAPTISATDELIGETIIAGTGGYTYGTGVTQYLHVYPAELNLQNASGLNPFADNYVFNDSTGSAYEVTCPVRFPNGASLTTTADTIKLWLSSNGTDALEVKLFKKAKPAADGFSFWPFDELFSASTTVSTNDYISTTYNGAYTVDNSFTGNVYILSVSFPVKISSNAPKFWGITFSYIMDQVNN